MTKERDLCIGKAKRTWDLLSPRQMIFAFMSLFSLALILRNSDVAIEYMSEGLRLCAVTVIPSLFPFMVLSDLVVSSGAATLFGRLLGRPMRFLFGVSGEGGCAVVLGALCGFPIGAKTALAVYDSGRISKWELERLLTISGVPSSAFLISAVGVSLFGSRAFGYTLYAATLAAAAIVGIAQNIFSRKKESPLAEERSPRQSSSRGGGLCVGDFTGAVTSSAMGIIKICAFVVFFSAFLGTLSSALDAVTLPPSLTALVFGLFELTGGMAEAAALPYEQGRLIAAFISGWSGFSVHFQIMSICADRGISFKPYFAAKLAQGVVATALVFLFV